jgi:hypothetical protein
VKFRVVNLSKELKTTAVGVRRVEGIQHLDVVEDFPQGVRAKVFFLKGVESWKSQREENLRRI